MLISQRTWWHGRVSLCNNVHGRYFKGAAPHCMRIPGMTKYPTDREIPTGLGLGLGLGLVSQSMRSVRSLRYFVGPCGFPCARHSQAAVVLKSAISAYSASSR